MSNRRPPNRRHRPRHARYAALALAVALLPIASPPARAEALSPQLQAIVTQYVGPLVGDPALIAAVRAQNAETADYDEAGIAALDAHWKSEIGASEIPTISKVWGNAVADQLRAQVEASGGLIREVLLMDARGLNVAVSHLTSDYWQGDEDKYLETYPHGAGAVHLGPVEFDESSQVYMQQLSMTVSDPQSGEPLGALTIGLDAERLP
ncbi:hypothetical protein [Alloyangia pacifica]|uniref:Uncharacterized protein n=1 Tax=Alloyangia pacifica TaxID=311180 RepID=A0A1I6P2B4_9RHOB|nr:hypothetical protein [Alloyangia pacifica]SDH53375.1 hypothetical protein SAMN04488245_10838 [Alloyangia pacifica]SFS34293.1 hypothetical protein SAMN04488050_101265 [Alloyangia pacifica]